MPRSRVRLNECFEQPCTGNRRANKNKSNEEDMLKSLDSGWISAASEKHLMPTQLPVLSWKYSTVVSTRYSPMIILPGQFYALYIEKAKSGLGESWRSFNINEADENPRAAKGQNVVCIAVAD